MLGLRRHFLLDPSITFLNHGSFGATPRKVFHAYQRWQREMESNPVRFMGRLKELLEESRGRLGQYLNVPASDLVHFQNPTSAFNAAAGLLCLSALAA